METQKVARLRVGIGEPSTSALDHVLSRFEPTEMADLARVLDAAADAVEDWAHSGAPRAANRWNAWQLPPTAPAPGEDRAPGDDPGPGTSGGPMPTPGPPTPALGSPTPGPDGIVRTRTGWRKLLPGLGRTEPRP